MDIVNILQNISGFFGLDWGSLVTIAISVTVVVNFLKATKPFANFVQGGSIPYVTAVLSLAVCAVTMWGAWLSILVGAGLITVLSVGGWATAKTLIHKVGTEPTNSSGGSK